MIFQRFRKIGAAYQQARRARDIAQVLLKYGYHDLAQHLPLPRPTRLPLRRVRLRQVELAQMSQPERLRRACEELGPTFVKLGQLAAARTRILPPAFTEELAKLQDQVAALPFSEIQRVLQEELGRPCGDVFASVEEVPLAAASIAQVHRATLLTGESVVVKVQRPGIQKVVSEDLALLRQLASLAEAHFPEWRWHQPVALIDELGRNLERELDFSCEASHLQRFTYQFREEMTLYVPRLFPELTTSRLLVMEYVDGIKVSRLDELSAAGIDRGMLAERIADLVMKQIFAFGFFHADPHPGNLRVLPDQRVCFLDFGMMGFLDLRTRETFVDLVLGIARHSEGQVAKALLRLTETEVEPVLASFEADVAEFMHQHFYRPAGEIQFSNLVTQLVRLATRHRLRLPPDLVVMLRALSLTEELVRHLKPQHDLIAQAQPFMRRTRLARLHPRRVWLTASDAFQELAETAQELPHELRRIVAQVRSGQARLNFHHEGLEPASNALERSANRLSFAVVVAALIISSSLMIRSKVPPLWGEVSGIGLIGYVLAGVLGLWLLIGILRHGKM